MMDWRVELLWMYWGGVREVGVEDWMIPVD